MGTFTTNSASNSILDLYQTNTSNGTKRTPGGYDVMDVGCYNNWTSSGVYGTHVPNMSSMEREWLGFGATPTELASTTSGVSRFPLTMQNNFAYSITTKNDADQWFVGKPSADEVGFPPAESRASSGTSTMRFMGRERRE